MKLLNREQIEGLAKFKSEDLLTTSFYLDTDKSRLTKKEIALSLKNLLNNGKSQLESMDLNRDKKTSLALDLGNISQFCSRNLATTNSAGIAIFSCSGSQFWHVFNLPSPPRNRVIFDQNPYVRSLSAILNEYYRICALTLDRKEAKWYDISMGEIYLLDTLVGNVPSHVKEGGWEGYESKRIERNIAKRLNEFFKKSARKTFNFFQKNDFDWLFLGCDNSYFPDLELLLHPYLKERLKGRLKVKPGDSPDRILKESLKLKEVLIRENEERNIQHFISELEKGGLAVSGLKSTLRSLNRGKVQTLLITRKFSKPGRICQRCKFLFVDEAQCPSCLRKTEILVDVIDEAVEAAFNKNCQVMHINPPKKLGRYGNIGAFLRYKI
ncbi:hypothetical protein ACFLRM_05420 [Acidobacteriota bacterium]